MKINKGNTISVWIALISSLAAVFAAWSAFISSRQTELANKVNLRPYVMIRNTKNILLYEGPPFIVLPYQLENVGTAPALNISKGYISYVVEKPNSERIIQDFREPQGKIDALLPSQISAIHLDNINITGFDSSNSNGGKFIKVILKIAYQGFVDVDRRIYYSKSILELYPKKTPDNKVVFIVSQPKLDFGFENNEGEREPMHKNLIFFIGGMFVSILLGHVATRKLIIFLRNKYEIKKEYKRPGALLGCLERFAFTLSIIINYPLFITVWLALKTAGRWSEHGLVVEELDEDEKSNKRKAPAAINIYLIGNLVSLLFSVLGAWIAKGFKLQ